jgi:hypothetical protein
MRADVATVRVDRDAVDVTARRRFRTATERIPIAPGRAAHDSLAHVLATSPLLPGGRNVRLRVVLETPRTIFAEGGGGDADHRVRPVLPSDLLDAVEAAIARRRVRGRATLELGPLVRADVLVGACLRSSFDGLGAVVDRSDAAVTVLLIGPTGLAWGRAAPVDDPVLAARLLIDRARSQVPNADALRWWCLHDVASSEGADAARRAREFEAAVASELEGTPLLGEVTA